MLGYTEENLCNLALKVFKHLDLHSSLNIKDETLGGFIREIAQNYNILPYHNFSHAFSVFQVKIALIMVPKC